MKKLIKKLLLIALLAGGIIFSFCFFSTKEKLNPFIDMMTNSVTYQGVGKIETLGLLKKIQESNTGRKLIIGDSVANQIYEYRNNEEYDVLCGNMAMTLVWQYIFVREYLANNMNAEEVILCVVPEIFERNFETDHTYSYMMIPLIKSGNEDVLGNKEMESLSKMYGSVFLTEQMVNFVGDSGLNTKLFLNMVKKYYDIFPEKKREVEKKKSIDFMLSENYILKIKELCDKNNVKFKMIPNPIKDIPENKEKLKILEKVYNKSPLYEINPKFFEQVIFFEEKYFKDELHFTDVFLQDGGKNQIIKQIQETTGLLDGLLEKTKK